MSRVLRKKPRRRERIKVQGKTHLPEPESRHKGREKGGLLDKTRTVRDRDVVLEVLVVTVIVLTGPLPHCLLPTLRPLLRVQAPVVIPFVTSSLLLLGEYRVQFSRHDSCKYFFGLIGLFQT